MHITFSEVSLPVSKKIACECCGKPLTRKGKLWQTINPFNLNGHGVPKSREEIVAELTERAKDWHPENRTCRACDQKADAA